MNSPVSITRHEARQLILTCQGLVGRRKENTEIIQQLGYVQIDTISVTERSHHHVFYSRNRSYRQIQLSQLMKDKTIFEYWSHAAAFLPIADFRFSLFQKEGFKQGANHWFERDEKVERYVLERITAEGPLQSKDFEGPKNQKHTWSSWKPAKKALTNLFMEGSLMIADRSGFQKIFDLSERVYPPMTNMSVPSEKEYCEHLIVNAVKANGLVTLEEIAYLRRGMKQPVRQRVLELLEEGSLLQVRIGRTEHVYYTTPEVLEMLKGKQSTSRKVHILNPFDNLLIQRKRMKDIFDFDYLLECYVPQQKRVFGYYTLPVLYGNHFVARLDARADRKTGLFSVKDFWYEKGFKPGKGFLESYDQKLRQFARFCGCDVIQQLPS